MKRDPGALANSAYDVLVVGGGIYGACTVWDAAQRGLSAALVEKGDFGSATSSNSMKTVHGGLRYLQDFNFPLMRTMISERRAWLTIAPHLVRPLPLLFPTSGRGLHSKYVLNMALKLTDLLGFDRNRGLGEESRLPPSRVLDHQEVLARLPGLPSSNAISGAAMWYDAQIYNTEQMLISLLKSAVRQGAVVANYVRADSLLLSDGLVRGARVHDLESGEAFDVRARFVVNATGPWIEQLLPPRAEERPRYRLSRAVNVVVPQFIEEVGVGLRSSVQMEGDNRRPRAGKTLFVVPWRDLSIIGTMHGSPVDRPEQVGPVEPEIERLISGINEAYPGGGLSFDDVRMVHAGLQPLDPDRSSGDRPILLRESELVDHEDEHGIQGLISLVGAKYTSARWLAEKAIDQVTRRLNIKSPPSRTDTTPVFGGELSSLESEMANLQNRYPDLTRSTIKQLVNTYGSEVERVLSWAEGEPALLQGISGQDNVLRCQVLYAVHEEMARRPSDFILRRTELGSAGPPPQVALSEIHDMMADALGWPLAHGSWDKQEEMF